MACAWSLIEQGHAVTVLERDEPGHGASFGNAGTIAPYGVLPVAQPGIWRDMPALLFSKDSPFKINWKRVPQLTPWLLRFLRESAPRRFRHNACLLSKLLEGAGEEWELLLANAGAEDLAVSNGALHIYCDSNNWERDQKHIRYREQFGIEQHILDTNAILDLEPVLAKHSVGGVYFPNAFHIRDPLVLVQRLAAAVDRRGGDLLQRTAYGLECSGPRVSIATDQGNLFADRVVVAAGAWSGSLAASIGDYIPLDTERGYHLEFPRDMSTLQRPCCPVEWAFYMTPMTGRLRIAGTVELSQRDAPPTKQRFEYIQSRAEQLLGPLGKPSSQWLGLRPSLPDSIPVLGPSPRDNRIIYAFGHGHLGLTLAARTAQLIVDCIDGAPPEWLHQCSAGRF